MSAVGVYSVIVLAFQSRCAGRSLDFTSPNIHYDESSQLNQVVVAESLRNIGRSYLSTKQYGKAASCYAAVLQVMEGVGGTESGELRRRCGLTLAECEIKSGNLYAAIARCSEVIEECPSLDDEDTMDEESSKIKEGNFDEKNKLRQVLGQAYYRRGVALSRLDEPDLALLDVQEASKQIPDDFKILQRLETLESIIMNFNRETDLEESNVKEELEEQLQCIAEDAQANYQRPYFSRKQISDLLQRKQDANSIGLKSPPKLGGVGDLFAGGIGSLFGQQGNKAGGGGMLSNVGMMLQMVGVIDNDTATLIKEIESALTDAYQIFKDFYKLIIAHRSQIIASLSIVWVALTFMPGRTRR